MGLWLYRTRRYTRSARPAPWTYPGENSRSAWLADRSYPRNSIQCLYRVPIKLVGSWAYIMNNIHPCEVSFQRNLLQWSRWRDRHQGRQRMSMYRNVSRLARWQALEHLTTSCHIPAKWSRRNLNSPPKSTSRRYLVR